MVHLASYLIPRPLRDMVFSDPKQSAEAIILAGTRISTFVLILLAVTYSTPSRVSSTLRNNIILCVGGCLSLPATVLSLGSFACVGVFQLIQDGATKNVMRVAGPLVAISYAILEFHDTWKFGLLEPAFDWIRQKFAEPLAHVVGKTRAFIQTYFPPQPLKDVNPFNMRFQQDAERVLLAAQRITAGALMAFLLFRYGPVLNRMKAGRFLPLAGFAGCYSLSVPATLIGTSSFITVGLIELIVKRQLTKETFAVIGVNYLAWSHWNVSFPIKFTAGIITGSLIMWMAKWPLTNGHFALLGTLETFSIIRAYDQEVAPTPLMPHFFNRAFQFSPNLLDKMFVKVSQRYSGTAFRYLGRPVK